MNIDVEKENKTLLKMYRNLLQKASPYLQGDDQKTIRKAFVFATEAHKDMRRKSGEPFIYHPVAVATIVTEEIGLGTTSIVSALLHDVVEDTEYTFNDIETHFGSKVAKIVEGLTKISETSAKGDSLQAENFRKMLLTISEDIRVVLVKIADRLHNMRTLESMPKDKRLKIKSETEYIYAPLAHRLGLYNIKSELEDLSLKYSDRRTYDEISEKLRKSEPARVKFTNTFTEPIKRDLDRMGIKYRIKSRTKSIRSIFNKMRKQNIPFEEVFDLFAIRIIFGSTMEMEKAKCWQIYSVVTDHYRPNVSRLRDWVSMPKANGYESLHTTVMGPEGHWVEVQVRSERMDEIAEKGYAAHWKYKEKGKGGAQNGKPREQGIESWLNAVREMMENDKMSAIEFLDDFRSNLFNKEVFAFTPKGDLKVFPKGSTVLDFAFDIHTEVGAKCLGAKINGRLVPLNHELKNGDQIEILTANKPKATEGWLQFVKTSRARAKIKSYLKEDKRKMSELGREIVERKLKQMHLPFNDRTLKQLKDYFGLQTELDLYSQVGEGIIDHTEIKKFNEQHKQNEKLRSEKIVPETAKEFKKRIRRIRQDGDELVIGEDMESVHYSLAKCCNPIFGDDIFGFITINNGIKIHRTNCPNAVSMMANYGYRIIKARWANSQDSEYEIKLKVEGTDRVGLVNDVTKIISTQMCVNIKSISIDTESSIFKGTIGLSVHDTDEADNLINNLKDIDGIVKVIRLEE
ncbi:RelA/SpoT family protein [Limibacter armeniacum]|uniref:RelA/SpoT family protein n=1 Tax=Limibacter armeniacum TaxID=466084 RepID=UPI002FE5DA52